MKTCKTNQYNNLVSSEATDEQLINQYNSMIGYHDIEKESRRKKRSKKGYRN